MKEEDLYQIDFKTCPELILFIELNNTINKNLELLLVQKKEYSDEEVVANLQKSILIIVNTIRFNVKDPVTDGRISTNATEWFINWHEYLRSVSDKEKEKINKDIKRWYNDNSYSLSKWYPRENYKTN